MKEETDMKHHHHNHMQGDPAASEVTATVSYSEGTITIKLEDDEGHAPELAIAHEKDMHIIIVSEDLKEYHHVHSEAKGKGVYVVRQELKSDQYIVFLDIKPIEKSYFVSPIPLRIEKTETKEASIDADADNKTKIVNRKKVTLEPVNAKVGEESSLVFNLHGENPKTYLGALGHVVAVDEHAKHYVHIHPNNDNETIFDAHFSEAGTYKLWAEFNFEDAGVLVFPYVIEVKPS